jgi:hypothetical protein
MVSDMPMRRWLHRHIHERQHPINHPGASEVVPNNGYNDRDHGDYTELGIMIAHKIRAWVTMEIQR